MTAISLYISTCRYVMQANAADHDSWTDLYRYLPYLRQALSCCVCGNIISKPRGPSHSECLHNVCTHCVGGKMRLKPSCSWCKDYVDFRDNTHLRILVLCFQKLCEYIYATQIWTELTVSSPNGETNPLVSIIKEAMAFEDDYVSNTHIPNLPMAMPVLTPATIKPIRKRNGSNREQPADDISEGSSQDPPTLSPECDTNPFEKDGTKSCSSKEEKYAHIGLGYDSVSAHIHPDMNQVKLGVDAYIGRSHHVGCKNNKSEKQLEVHAEEVGRKSWKNQRSNSQDNIFEPPSKRTRASSLPTGSELSRKVCRCARNNPPNRLTCLGQRCPCYSSRVPCIGCMCRGCRNPRKLDFKVLTDPDGGHCDSECGTGLNV
ncbi:E3 ubiquitin-protein ligase MSL2-like [Haliotis rufescens]|uniref:E3 ubiquitin-protein ligase MSL2-like n=1 Tax=Haliotis rufescens TaxID=6454 RepID=UPI001EAFD98F|nr:E3 ubiquitin-protein ligase MSL2-like [Haliotis rufescens]